MRSRQAAQVLCLASTLLMHRSRAAAQPALSRHIADYSLEASLDQAHRVIVGREHVHWVNASRVAATELWWHLYMNGFAGPDTHFMRTGGARGHRGHARGDWGRIEVTSLRLRSGEDLLAGASADPARPTDATELRTPLPRVVEPGGAIDLECAFRVTLPTAFARTGRVGEMVFAGQWFPKLAVRERDGGWAHFPFHFQSEFYADFGDYDLWLETPGADVVGASGQLAETVTAAVGRVRRHFVAHDVHDVAWTAWPHYRERSARLHGIAVRVLHPPGLDRVAARQLEVLDRAIPLFARAYGPYPYPTLTVVVPPREGQGVGGMEYPTLITTWGDWWAPAGIRDIEWVAVHEFAHQYFYGLLASNEAKWPFLDEGLAEYATACVLGEIYGDGAELVDLLGLRVSLWAVHGGLSGAIGRSGPVARDAAEFPSFGSYGSHVYNRTATILRTVERSFGPALTASALYRYAHEQRFRHPQPGDLIDAYARTPGGRAAADFLRAALFSDAGVDLRVLSVGEREAVIERRGALAWPTTIEVRARDGTHERVQWDGTGDQFHVRAPAMSPLHSVRLDPDARAPIDRDRLDDARLTHGARGSFVALVASLAYWFGVVLGALGP